MVEVKLERGIFICRNRKGEEFNKFPVTNAPELRSQLTLEDLVNEPRTVYDYLGTAICDLLDIGSYKEAAAEKLSSDPEDLGIPYGWRVIERKPYGNGFEIVLCQQHGRLYKYVTWVHSTDLKANQGHNSTCVHGNYHRALIDAAKDFETRGNG